jgi:colicin import membrane protein
MLPNRNRSTITRKSMEPRLWRMLLLSMGVHLLVIFLFSGVMTTGKRRERPPVYYVDLVQMPVQDPQAGRPDGRPEPPKPAPQPPAPAPPPRPEPVKAPPPPPPAPKPAVKAPAPAPKPAPKPSTPPAATAKPAPAPPAPQAPQASEADLAKRLEEMRRQQEIERLKQDLASLAAKDSRAAPTEAPLGMPTGRGTEAGVDQQTWIETFLKKNWSLSRHQVPHLNFSLEVLIIYSENGELQSYRFQKPSGNQVFDDSVTRAILKERQLPFQPGRRLEIGVTFNLKDLMD